MAKIGLKKQQKIVKWRISYFINRFNNFLDNFYVFTLSSFTNFFFLDTGRYFSTLSIIIILFKGLVSSLITVYNYKGRLFLNVTYSKVS